MYEFPYGFSIQDSTCVLLVTILSVLSTAKLFPITVLSSIYNLAPNPAYSKYILQLSVEL